MKKLFSLLMVSILSVAQMMAAEVPAFPGAQGFARYTTSGGRGASKARIYHVTRLADDSNKGSLRWAVSQTSPSIIVFDVSGYIDLKSDLKIGKSNITIAGQTAPGDGITIRYYTVTVAADNVIMRFLRFRRSQVKDVNDGADACWGRNKKNIILDHCSFSWSIDELASFYDNVNFTMQWCMLGEALGDPGHSKGQHSYGGIWGGKGASFHHNFLCNMQNRVPRFNGARYNYTKDMPTTYKNALQWENVDFRNCVMANWGTGGCYGGPGGGQINMVNNYYNGGPNTSNPTVITTASVANSTTSKDNKTFWNYFSRYYISGNYVTKAGAQAANYDWKGVKYDSGLKTLNGERYIPDADHKFANVTWTNIDGVDCVPIKMDEPIPCGDVTTHTAEKAYEKVLATAGCSYVRDAVDARYVEEARTGTIVYKGETSGRYGIVDYINDPSSATQYSYRPSFPELKSETRLADYDTDQDGMPDAWEIANGLNPKDASDAVTKTLDAVAKGGKGWYTNLEVYLNSIVEDIVKAENADAENAVEEYYPAYVKPTAVGCVKTAPSASAIKKIEYLSLDGKVLSEPAEGVSIRRIIYNDNTVNIDKVLK